MEQQRKTTAPNLRFYKIQSGPCVIPPKNVFMTNISKSMSTKIQCFMSML